MIAKKKAKAKRVNGERAYSQALSEMREKEPDVLRALNLLQVAVSEGVCEAIYALGTWHLFGKEPYVKKNPERGVRMILRAAELGVVDAMYDAGASYELATGVRRNVRKAFEYYLKAAIRGDVDAVNEVARCYHWGIGIAKDRRLSRLWYERARELGTEE